MSRWWWLPLTLLITGAALLAAGFGIAVAATGFPAPIQDMNAASPDELEAFYGRHPMLADGLWVAGWVAIGGAAIAAAIALVRSTWRDFDRTRRRRSHRGLSNET